MKRRTKEIYLHAAQYITNLIFAAISINIWGRGTGKTYGVTALKAYLFVTTMPRSVGAIGCPSFQHMMEHIFPQIVKFWETIGLVEGRDFICFDKPPKEWETAYVKPRDYKRTIFFRNGSAIKLFSFNYNSLANGESIDWMIIDEARLCKEKAVAEALKCLRGNEEHFGHLSQHKSITYVTDMPRTPSEFWLLRYKEQEKLDRKIEIEEIAEMLAYCNEQALLNPSERKKKQHKENALVLSAELNERCKDLTYMCFASSLENIYALGLDTIKNWYRSKSSESDFDLSVLNLIPKQVENCFYAGLDKDKHGYITPVSNYADAIDYRGTRDCRWDGDIDEDQPLFIGMDYNTDITSLAVGQMHNGKVRLLKTMWVTAPKKRGDVIQDFAEYYQYFPSKEVVYFYDNTAKGTDADKNEKQTYAVRTIDELTELGFNVTAINLTQTRHENRYDTWGDILQGGTPQNPFGFEYNIENASQFEHCATLTQTRIEYKEFHNRTTKDKRSEKSRKIRPENASHLTEAVDTLMDGITKYYLQYEEA